MMRRLALLFINVILLRLLVSMGRTTFSGQSLYSSIFIRSICCPSHAQDQRLLLKNGCMLIIGATYYIGLFVNPIYIYIYIYI
ncbi:hypothetical protein PRUPE_2G189700 [Prunus persica]|uniref:Uncharacterized protein n=1 Tax=Prunus persica TaxID=3760 RepID=A0A251QI29_PRUPE|nr:hypothetical protein PRUPE_2G189700 [Prunus persica]